MKILRKILFPLIWLKEKKLSAIAQAYIDFLKLHKESISEVHFSMNI